MNKPPKYEKNSLKITWIPLSDLRASKRNARKHSAEQIANIAESIRSFGWTNPILVDGDGEIIAGHARFEAAKRLKLKSVPVIHIHHLNEEQKRAYMLADNQLALLSEWDKDLLERELAELKELDLDFDLGVTGFDLEALDISIEAVEEDKSRAKDAPQGRVNKKSERKSKSRRKLTQDGDGLKPVSRPGDLWVMGDHLLICGTALRDNDVMRRLMQDERAQMAFSALPIKVGIEPSAELGAAKRLTFKGITGHLKPDELTSHLVEDLSRQLTNCEGNAAQFLLAPAGALNEVLEACRYVCPIDEVRDFGGDLLFVAGPQLESLACGDNDILVEMAVRDREAASPRQLAKEVILEASKAGDLVLDVYGSGGATLMACEETGRCARVIELSGAKVDAVIRRWQDLTGLEARLEQTGQTFGEVRQERMSQGVDENPYSDPVLEELLADEEGGA